MGIFKIKNPRFSDCKTVLSHFLKYNGDATFISKFKQHLFQIQTNRQKKKKRKNYIKTLPLDSSDVVF